MTPRTSTSPKHDNEATAVGEAKDPERRPARHYTEYRDVIYQLVKFRNWAFKAAEQAQAWEWTTDLRAEYDDQIDGVRGALENMTVAPDLDQALAKLLEGEAPK